MPISSASTVLTCAVTGSSLDLKFPDDWPFEERITHFWRCCQGQLRIALQKTGYSRSSIASYSLSIAFTTAARASPALSTRCAAMDGGPVHGRVRGGGEFLSVGLGARAHLADPGCQHQADWA